MIPIGMLLALLSAGLLAYTYVGYPLVLKILALSRRPDGISRAPMGTLPLISVTVPMYNEEANAAELVESLLALDYPAGRRQILIVSDGSTDRTDAIVRSYADRGVELLSLPVRSGKTACENAASQRLVGEIVVNTDASIRILPRSLKPLIAPFADPRVGLVSGRDISVNRGQSPANVGESGYVGYEMGIRDLETATYGIVGASGCLYAIRIPLHRIPVPASLSRDFSAALKCEEHGYRAVSVSDAVCRVPRVPLPFARSTSAR